MDETFENGMELFCQDGVLLKSATANFMQYINTSGTLSIVEYPNSCGTRFIEWKANDITIDSDVQDQEWAVVNTVERRTRTFSGSAPLRILKINTRDIKSFRVTRFNQKLSFNDASRKPICTFIFQHGNADSLVAALRGGLLPAAPAREKNLYMVLEQTDITHLNKSFAELNLFPEQGSDYVWRFLRNLHHRPYETTMEAFSKLTDIIYRGPELPMRLNDAEVEDLLTRSLTTMDSAGGGEYEVVGAESILTPPPKVHRGKPLSLEQWRGLMDADGRIPDVEGVKMLIFRGGIESELRSEVWKFLLGYFPWDSSYEEREVLVQDLQVQYDQIKQQWTSMTLKQEENHSEYRERKSLVEKDVNRTDRADPFYAGDNNPNLIMLNDVLMSYVMYNFDLGYVQGMSDLCAPLIRELQNESPTFWCFTGFMDRVAPNFEQDQHDIKEQLEALHELLTICEPELASYLKQHESHNMYFCFRWLLVWFKREFNTQNLSKLWEVLWTGLPCRNFQLLIAVAILKKEKVKLEERRSFAGILKHVNELSMRIDLEETLIGAEEIYHQLVAAKNLPDTIRATLGLPPKVSNTPINTSLELDEAAYDRALDMSYI